MVRGARRSGRTRAWAFVGVRIRRRPGRSGVERQLIQRGLSAPTARDQPQQAEVRQLFERSADPADAGAAAIGHGALRRPAPAVIIRQAQHQQQDAQRQRAQGVDHAAVDQVIGQLREASAARWSSRA
jgi:hypothetical protein